jgi:hypothetical protein
MEGERRPIVHGVRDTEEIIRIFTYRTGADGWGSDSRSMRYTRPVARMVARFGYRQAASMQIYITWLGCPKTVAATRESQLPSRNFLTMPRRRHLTPASNKSTGTAEIASHWPVRLSITPSARCPPLHRFLRCESEARGRAAADLNPGPSELDFIEARHCWQSMCRASVVTTCDPRELPLLTAKLLV